MQDGFAWACEFGRTAVVDFLLQRGVPLDAKLRHDKETGLHWAAYGGHADTVKLLIERGAPVHALDESYGGTPLEWAIYAWGNRGGARSGESYYEVAALLVRAGAKVDPDWYEDDEDRNRAAGKVRADPRMLAALGGKALQ
jgi:ankyrin repeat protein